MSRTDSRRYDVAVVGAGPAGSLYALARARNGARVALLEGNPKASQRLAGEWLHPPAVRMLEEVGVRLDTPRPGVTGKGFVVIPEDGSEPIVLPYPDGSHAAVREHLALVSALREAVENEPGVDFILGARVSAIEDDQVIFTSNGAEKSVSAARIVGADGRSSIVRQSLGLTTQRTICSWMLGVKLTGVRLPAEGYGHLWLGGPGPILMYRLGEDCVRVIVDVAPDRWTPRNRIGFLSSAYADRLEDPLRRAFLEALLAGRFHVAANSSIPRVTYGSASRVLIGDAAGHYHPLTAVGMTLGFGDAVALAERDDFQDFTSGRLEETRVPELLAMGLYEIFADHRAEAAAVRQAIFQRWRASSAARNETMRLLACEDTSLIHFGSALCVTVVRAISGVAGRAHGGPVRHRTRGVIPGIVARLGWFLRGVQQLRKAKHTGREMDARARNILAHAFPISMPSAANAFRTDGQREAAPPDAGPALRLAARRLLRLQDENGAWEGEVIWCPMLTAQYVLTHHIIGRPLNPGRRRRVLRYFERTRLEGGLWGLHEHAPPHLFVTTLVYVAMRLLGVERNDPLVEPARRFIRAEGVLGIPSWGKFWLALLNLYGWRGVNAVLPEVWSLPRWAPLHPSNWYCHSRLIYMAMAAIYSHRYQVAVTPLIASLREELYPARYAGIDFSSARNLLRRADLYARPSVWLRAGYEFARLFDRFHSRRQRARSMEAIVRHIRWELQVSDHMSISPVSGLLNIVALWMHDPDDIDLQRAVAQLDGWLWEDKEGGARVAGARSTSWDTAFSLQALATVPEFGGVQDALRRGAEFLRRQQVSTSFEGYREAYRADPKGGWCFAAGGHGWPVTDCTAEAVLGNVAACSEESGRVSLDDAAEFILRGQNRDGGFGTYEARRTVIGLEWLNPAEMFGDSMTEHSYVECTASCLSALVVCKDKFGQIRNQAVTRAVLRADAWLRRAQAADGSWRGAWGVCFIYGTYFGIRGLLAGGAQRDDPALRAACQWLLDRQLFDGGWGEHYIGCLTGQYVAREESQVIQTAWALIALIEAGDPDRNAISRGAKFLLDAQNADGTWPRQYMSGVFFRTALLDYALYRQYFPLRALGLYERQR